jgi:tetratricopeptide (TPR) repeat protein
MFEEDIRQRGENRSPGDFSCSTHITRTIAGDLSELGNIYEALGIIAATTGQITEALTYLNSALVIFEEQNNLRSMANACNNIGAALLMKADHAAADEYYRRSLSLAERVGDLPLVSTVSINLGELAALTGNLLEAETWYRRSLELATRVNIRSDMCHVNCALAINLQDQGKLSDAIGAVHRALALSREIKSPPMTGIALITLANLRMTMVEQEQAARKVDVRDPIISNRLKRILATLHHALALNGLRAEEMAKGRLALATSLLWQGALEAARELAFQTMEVVEEQQHFQLLTQPRRLLGCILSTTGRHVEADQYFQQAMQTSQDYGMRLEYARTLFSWGETLLRRNVPLEVAFQQGLHYLQEAQDIFAMCHAAIDLERVKRTLAEQKRRL